MKKDIVNADGLTYAKKESGTPFLGGISTSCMKCGVYKLRKYGNFYRIFGSRWFICFECKPLKKNSEE